MKLDLTEEWYDSEVVGDAAASITAGIMSSQRLHTFSTREVPSLSFGRLINLSRRSREFSLRELANRSDVDLDQLYTIEHESNSLPQPETVCKLAKVLELPSAKLCSMYLVTPNAADHIREAPAAFAVNVDAVNRLSSEERDMLREFVANLCKG
jgi:transcriptional regulator with XRE-family HTH domain